MKTINFRYLDLFKTPKGNDTSGTVKPIAHLIVLIAGLTIACSLGPGATETVLTPIVPSTEDLACTNEFSEFEQLYQEKREQGFDLTQVDEFLELYAEACLDQNFLEATEIIIMATEALEQMGESPSSLNGSQLSPTITPTLPPVSTNHPIEPPSSPSPVEQQKIVPPTKGIYLGAYNFDDNGLSAFEEAIGKKVAILGHSYDIKDGGTENTLPFFDIAGHERWRQNGYITIYNLETGLEFPNPQFTPQDIIEGRP